MRALLLDFPGDPSRLRVGEVDPPVPAPGQVLLRVSACGLNPVDTGLIRRGHPDWTWPHTPGLDVAGTVVGLGAGVSRFAVGDRIACHHDLRAPGGLAEYAAVEASAGALIPDGVDFITAAALPCAGSTAYEAVIDRLRVGAGQLVLVNGGGGSVGSCAVQLAASAGAFVIATASASDHARVRALGAAEVVDYKAEDVARRIREITGGLGLDAIVDTVSAESASGALALLRHAGGIACVAGRASWDAVPAFTTAPSIHEIALGAAYAHGDARDRKHLGDMLGDLLGREAAGSLGLLIGQVIGLDEVREALSALPGRRVLGKTVVVL